MIAIQIKKFQLTKYNSLLQEVGAAVCYGNMCVNKKITFFLNISEESQHDLPVLL